MKEADRQTDRQTDRQAGRQTDRQYITKVHVVKKAAGKV
jgi:hypothetical protein